MIELELADVYDAAARATINERCAAAYLHDLRGSMHALFSAMELLGRSAKSGARDMTRIEKVRDLTKRAIEFHEKSTLGALQTLTLQRAAADALDVRALLAEALNFLRSEAANKAVVVSIAGDPGSIVSADRGTLRTVLVGLLAAALDETPSGAELPVSIAPVADCAVVSIGCDARYGEVREAGDWWQRPHERLPAKVLTLLFARNFLRANGGRLEVDATAQPRGAIRLHYPLVRGETTAAVPA